MINEPKVLICDLENILFPATEIYQDCLNLAFAEVTKGKVRFDKNKVKNILTGNSFADMIEFAISFKPQTKITEIEREVIVRKFVGHVENILTKGRNAGTKKEHLDVLRWFYKAGIPIVFCTNMNLEVMMKYLDATGYLQLADFCMCPDRFKQEHNLIFSPKPSKEMYQRILNRYGIEGDQALSIEGTTFGAQACKFLDINYIFCKSPELFKLKSVITGLEVLDVISFQ